MDSYQAKPLPPPVRPNMPKPLQFGESSSPSSSRSPHPSHVLPSPSAASISNAPGGGSASPGMPRSPTTMSPSPSASTSKLSVSLMSSASHASSDSSRTNATTSSSAAAPSDASTTTTKKSSVLSLLSSPALQTTFSLISSRTKRSTADSLQFIEPEKRKQYTVVCGIPISRTWIIVIVSVSVVLILLLIALVLLATVGARSLATSLVASAQVNLTSIVLSQSSANSIPYTAQMDLYNPGSQSAVMSFPSPLTIYYLDEVLGAITMQSFNVNSGMNHQISTLGTIQISNQTAFEGFMTSFSGGINSTWTLVGSAKLEGTFLGFTLPISDIPFWKSVIIVGIQLFGDQVTQAAKQLALANAYSNGDLGVVNVTPIGSFTLVSLSVLDGVSANELPIHVTAALTNVGTVAINSVGRLDFDLVYQGVKIGNMSNPDVTITTGLNFLQLTGYIVKTPENTDLLGEAFFFDFITHVSTTVSAEGIQIDPNTSNNLITSTLQNVLSTHTILTVINGLATTELIIRNATLDINLLKALEGSASIVAYISNPFDSVVTIKALDMSASINGIVAGNLVVTGSPIVIPPQGVITTSAVALKFHLSASLISSFLQLFSSQQIVSITGTMDVTLGDFSITVNYTNPSVPFLGATF